jgi:hypothetical protein
MVPRKLTEEMARAIEQADMPHAHKTLAELWQSVWSAALAAAPQPNHQGILNSSQPAAQPVIDHAEASGGIEGGPQEDRIEAAYWRFDARRSGYEQWKKAPMSERDAFKAELRNALEAEKVRAEMRLVARGWQPAAQPASAEPVAEAKLYTLPRDPAEVMRLALEEAARFMHGRQGEPGLHCCRWQPGKQRRRCPT